MGKNLHYSIRPFIENALNNHSAVEKLIPIELNNFYAYTIHRTGNMPPITLVLSDDYYFNELSLQSKPDILRNGGFILLAKPESKGIEESLPLEKLGIGKLKKLLGAIHRRDYWNYEIPKKKNS